MKKALLALLMAGMVCFLPACSDDDDPVTPPTEQGGDEGETGNEGGETPESEKTLQIIGLDVPASVTIGETLEIKGAEFPEGLEISLVPETDETVKFNLTYAPTASGLSCTLPAEVVAGKYKVVFAAKGFLDLVWKNLLEVIAPAPAKRTKSITLNIVMGADQMPIRQTVYEYASAEDRYPSVLSESYTMEEVVMTYNMTFDKNVISGVNQEQLINGDIKSFALTLENNNVKESTYTKQKSAGDKVYNRTWEYTPEGVCNSVNELFETPMTDLFIFDKAAQKNNPAGIDAGLLLFEYAAGSIGKGAGQKYDLTAGILLGCTGTRMEMLPSSINTSGNPVDVTYEADAEGYITKIGWSEMETMGADMQIVIEYENL